jgi:hypothetical protein
MRVMVMVMMTTQHPRPGGGDKGPGVRSRWVLGGWGGQPAGMKVVGWIVHWDGIIVERPTISMVHPGWVYPGEHPGVVSCWFCFTWNVDLDATSARDLDKLLIGHIGCTLEVSRIAG